MKRFRITYEIEDGYVGGSRPHTCYVKDYEIEYDMDEKDLSNIFWATIQEDMNNKVYPVTNMEDEFIEWAKEPPPPPPPPPKRIIREDVQIGRKKEKPDNKGEK